MICIPVVAATQAEAQNLEESGLLTQSVQR